MHKYGPIHKTIFNFSLAPHQVLELLGPLSMFNCVNLSAWAIHNVKLCQCICRANTYSILLLCESIFTRTICTRGLEALSTKVYQGLAALSIEVYQGLAALCT